MKINYSILFLFLASIAIFSFSSNPPNGRTGAPGEGTCAGCHTPPGSTSLNGSMDITGLPNTVLAGSTYTVTVTVNNPALNAVRAGFQMVAIDESNANTGTLSNPSANSTIASSGGKDYHEHAPAVAFGGNPSVSWTVEWTAPDNGTYADGDSLFLYGSSIIGNGSGAANDLTRLTSLRVDIENPPAPPVSIAVGNIVQASCSDASDGQATAEITGGTAPFDIQWDNGESGMMASMLSPGVHAVSVTDALNEMDETTFEIMAPSAIMISNEVVTATTCPDECDGSIDFDVSGGSPPYSYSIDGNDVPTLPITDLCPGAYSVIVTDANACTLEQTFEVLAPPAITVNNTIITNVTCNGGSDGSISIFVEGGTGNLSISWSNGGSGNTITDLTADTYTATIIDDNNCIHQEAFIVTEPDPLTVTIIESEPIPCFGLFGSLQVVENFISYNWSNGVQTALNEGLAAGDYSVTVIDDNGCEGIANYTLNEPNAIMLNFDVTHVEQGGDGSVAVTPTGGTSPYTYLWNTGSMDSLINNLNSGVYIVTVTDSNNCSIIDSVAVEDNCTLEISSASSTDVTCNGGADGTASITYTGTINDSLIIEWSNGDTSLMINNLEAGSYAVTISDGGACATDTTIIVSEPSPIMIDFVIIEYPSTEMSLDGSITANVSGGTGPNYILEWEGNQTDTLNNVGVGSYCLLVTDINGCTFKDSIQLTVETCDYELDLTYTDALCPGDNSGTASVSITGGTNVVTIWSTNDTSDMISGLTAGNYYVSAADSLGCTDTVFFTIDSYSDEIVILDTLYEAISCEDSLGSIQIILDENINGPFDYAWSNGDSTNLADSLEAGSYSLTVTNNFGCTTIFNVETQENFEEEISWEVNEVSVYLDDEGNAPAIMEGISNLVGGCEDSLYVVYPGDLLDCSDIGPGGVTVDIYNYDEIIDMDVVPYTVYDTIPPVFDCPDSIFIVDFVQCGPGVIFHNFTISGESIEDNCTEFNDTMVTLIYTVDTSGIYVDSFQIVDACGNSTTCIYEREYIVSSLVVEHETTDASCFGASDGCIDLDIIDGIPPFTIFPENICELGAGNYTVNIFDSLGCEVLLEITIDQPDEIIITEVDKGDEMPGQSDGFIDVTVTGGTGPYTFEWTENGEVVSTDEDLINFPSSQYELTVTDSTGCTQVLSTFIDVFNSLHDEAFAQIKMYPNPFNNQIIIEGLDNHDANIEVLNILGQPMEYVLQKEGDQAVLSTDALINGVYFVKVSIDEQFRSFRMTKSAQ